MRQDTFRGMFFSQFIMFCIIATAANAFFNHGITNIESAAEAAKALLPLAGRFTSIIFSLGIIGTGLLAVPILSASASYAISEAMNWNEGLDKKIFQAKGFYGVIILATALGILFNLLQINPIKALVWAAVLNGIATIPLIFIILKIANNKKIMGKYVNGIGTNVLGVLAFLLIVVSCILLFVLK
jgi:Mn2+/Fe2+ NRAMP family transporter